MSVTLKSKNIKKPVRILLWIAGIIILLFGVAFSALHVDAVQTFLARRLTAYLSHELKTEVNVDRVSIRFLKSAVLKGFYISDQHSDTLLYAEELNVSILDIVTSAHALDLGNITLKGGEFKLHHYKNDKHDNLYFLTDYLSGSDTGSSAPWKVKVRSLSLENMQFSHLDERDTSKTSGVNFSDLNVSNINGEFTNFSTINDSIFVKINSLSFKDKSGFQINSFKADAKIASNEIRLHNLFIKSPFTTIKTDLTFQFNNFNSFDEFTSQIHWDSDFDSSTVSFTDIAFFAPELKGIDKSLKIDGAFKGTVKNFKGKNVTIQWGNRSLFKGNVAMKGLPEIDDTYMDISADEIRTDKDDIEWISIPPFEDHAHLILPDNMNLLGLVSFKGKFAGFVSDFVAYGNASTALGTVSSDINLKYIKESNTSVYSGKLSTLNFDVGKIAMIPDLGKVSLNLNVKGSGLKLSNINAKLEGNVSALVYKNYNYKNIDVDGQVAKRLFNGALAIHEDNVDLDFNGSVDYRNKLPEFNFIANIKRADLDTLNLFHREQKSVLSTTISTSFTGNKLDNITGKINIINTDFQSGTKLFRINSIDINAEKAGNIRTFDMISDNIDAHLKGEFELAKLGDAFKEIIPRYLPSVILPQKSFYSRQNFTYEIRLKNVNLFAQTFLPGWTFSPNTILSGNFNSITNNFNLDLNSDYLQYKNFALNHINIRSDASEGKLQLETHAANLTNKENNFIDLPEIELTAVNNQINYTIHLSDADSFPNRAHLGGSVNFLSATDFTVKIDTSSIFIEDQEWKLDKANSAHFDSSAINLSGFTFQQNEETISVEGSVGKKESDRLEVRIKGFRLDHINSLMGSSPTRLAGVINGEVMLTDIFHQFQLETDLKIRDLAINLDTIGNASIISRYNSSQDVVVSNISIVKGVSKIVDITGNYFVNKENNNLEYSIKLNNLYIHPVEQYLTGIMSEVYGKLSADVKLSGTLKKPVFTGTVDFNKTSLIVDYLHTRYTFSTSVKVSGNEFDLEGLTVTDVNNNEANVKGKIYHNYFHNFNFDVELQPKKFQVLNTTGKDNSLYYGVANATGFAHFSGPIESMNMDISLSPDKGTVLNIPLNTTEDLSANGFISFIDRSRDSTKGITRNKVDLSGVKLNMDLDMNRNAEIKIIFDEKIGDVITGTGTGSLRLDINTAGNFNMYGTYSIDKGEYLFTLQNLINKKFIIDPGSKITWSGDPDEALVDLSAVYVVYTSTLGNVLQDTANYKRRIPVDCRLFLTTKLMNPVINYEISVRGLHPTDEALFRSILNSEQEINRQMFGLLLFNQFLPTSGAGQSVARFDAGAGGKASASELLSNQVSNWIGQLSKAVNIGFNYRAKDIYTNQEFQFIVSKSLFNDRLTLEGNVGYIDDPSYTNSNVVGDFYAEYKVSEDGRFRLKGFNRSNADNIINYAQSPYTQGLGFFYRKEFNSFGDLFARWRAKNKQEEQAPVINQ